jgi:single-strand DNA-binding protein
MERFTFADCTIQGRLIRDPELHTTPSGSARCQTAINWYSGKHANGEPYYSLIDVTIWKEAGMDAVDNLRKGDRVKMVGSLKREQWQDRNTGGNRSKHVLHVWDAVELIERPNQDQPAQPSQPTYEDIPF